MTEYKITMQSGREFMYKSDIKLDAFEYNINYEKPLKINDSLAINCKYIESIEVEDGQ